MLVCLLVYVEVFMKGWMSVPDTKHRDNFFCALIHPSMLVKTHIVFLSLNHILAFNIINLGQSDPFNPCCFFTFIYWRVKVWFFWIFYSFWTDNLNNFFESQTCLSMWYQTSFACCVSDCQGRRVFVAFADQLIKSNVSFVLLV